MWVCPDTRTVLGLADVPDMGAQAHSVAACRPGESGMTNHSKTGGTVHEYSRTP